MALTLCASFFCNAGKHRSVAWVDLIRLGLLHMGLPKEHILDRHLSCAAMLRHGCQREGRSCPECNFECDRHAAMGARVAVALGDVWAYGSVMDAKHHRYLTMREVPTLADQEADVTVV